MRRCRVPTPIARLPPVRILTRYLVSRFLGNFAAFLAISTLVIVIVEMMLNLGDMFDEDAGLSGAGLYLLLRLPAYYFRDLIPIVAFAAAFFTLAQASRWLEILAMEAGGFSRLRIAAPILLAGAMLVATTLLVNETAVLNATREWNRRGTEEGQMPLTFRQGSFWYHRGRTIYNIGDADRATRTLRGVHIYELDEQGQLLRSIQARRAKMESADRWRFDRPLIRTFDSIDPFMAPASFRPRKEVTIELADSADMALMNADVTTLSLLDLHDAIESGASGGRRSQQLQALYHARLAEPLIVWVFVLVGLTLGIRVDHAQGLGMVSSAFYGIAVVAAFFGLQSLAGTLTSEGLLPPWPAPWALITGIGVFGAWRFYRIRG